MTPLELSRALWISLDPDGDRLVVVEVRAHAEFNVLVSLNTI